MPAPIAFLIALIVLCIVGAVLLYVARLVISGFAIPQPFANLFYAVCILLILGLFLSEVGWVGPAHGWRAWK